MSCVELPQTWLTPRSFWKAKAFCNECSSRVPPWCLFIYICFVYIHMHTTRYKHQTHSSALFTHSFRGRGTDGGNEASNWSKLLSFQESFDELWNTCSTALFLSLGALTLQVTCSLELHGMESAWHKGKSLTPLSCRDQYTSHEPVKLLLQPYSPSPWRVFLLAFIKIQLLFCTTFTNGFDLNMNNKCTTSIFARLLWESV